MNDGPAEPSTGTSIGLLLLTVFLFVLAGLEARVTLRDYVLPWGELIDDIRQEPAWERAGRLSVWVGPSQTDFIAFLRETLPLDASVIVPGKYHDPWSRYPNLMQYYLYPRNIVACAENDLLRCTGMISDKENVYILKSKLVTWEIPEVLNATAYLREDGQGVYRLP
jgi:hypothetical protein